MPDEVVMLGDSYMDYAHVGPDIMSAAGAMYRHYYLLGAAMNYGSGDANIPFQWDGKGVNGGTGSSALNDTAVKNPKDVKVVIMDGGGNDVLIDNRGCLGSATLSSSCTMAIDASLARGKTLITEMASGGVQHLVYYFYPHLDAVHGGGLLPTPAPGVNVSLDYALPKLEQECCGASFTSSASKQYCRGMGADGIDCIVIDTNPTFQGHNVEGQNYWFMGDNVHPNADGAAAIAKLVWSTMVQECIAQ